MGILIGILIIGSFADLWSQEGHKKGDITLIMFDAIWTITNNHGRLPPCALQLNPSPWPRSSSSSSGRPSSSLPSPSPPPPAPSAASPGGWTAASPCWESSTSATTTRRANQWSRSCPHGHSRPIGGLVEFPRGLCRPIAGLKYGRFCLKDMQLYTCVSFVHPNTHLVRGYGIMTHHLKQWDGCNLWTWCTSVNTLCRVVDTYIEEERIWMWKEVCRILLWLIQLVA